MKNFVLAAGMLAGLSLVPASAADLSECAAIPEDTQRLACYDALAKGRVTHESVFAEELSDLGHLKGGIRRQYRYVGGRILHWQQGPQ